MDELRTRDEEAGSKKEYQRPELTTWGTVEDLTLTGNTHPGSDGKGGSSLSNGR